MLCYHPGNIACLLFPIFRRNTFVVVNTAMKRCSAPPSSSSSSPIVKVRRVTGVVNSSQRSFSQNNVTRNTTTSTSIDLTLDDDNNNSTTIDLTEERMRRMEPEELNAELSRRGVDSTGLRSIWSEHLFSSSASNTRKSFSSTSSSAPNHNDPDILVLSPNTTYVLRFDGGSRGNPGLCGAGMVLYEKHNYTTELWCGSLFLSQRGTNNEAEYQALINGLKIAQSFGAQHIVCEGDSNLVVQQILGTYKVKSPNLIPLFKEALKAKESFRTFQIHHIPRAQNFRADELANEAMTSRRSKGLEALNR